MTHIRNREVMRNESKAGRLLGKAIRMIPVLLFPSRCPVCDRPVEQPEELICLKCLTRLVLLTPPWCVRCGKKIPEGGKLCADCRERNHEFARGRALYEYASVSGSLYRFKYAGRQEYAGFYGQQMAHFMEDFIRGVQPDGLIPIPLHPKRFRKRGYNQAAVLANVLGRQLGIPVYEKLLVRTRNTIPLKQLNYQERQINLKKAFNVVENDVKLESIILIDDIYTTGSTIDEAARVLHESGVKHVYFLTLAIGAGV